MALTVYDLAVEVVLYLVAFQRRSEAGEPLTYEDTRAEVLALLNDLEQRSHTEQGLWEHWTKARKPLVYLIDEVMILNCNWPHRQDWANECLEVTLLGHPTALAGEKFYEESDEALRELEVAERHERHDVRARVELVMVYYVCLQTGFKGKYALDMDAWREYKGHVFSKLPAYAQTRGKELFPETAKHTVSMDPNYEPVMRLAYVLMLFAGIIAVYLGVTYSNWNLMVSDLRENAAAVATGAPAAASPPTGVLATQPGS